MPYVNRVSNGPLDGALIVVDTELPIVAHCFVYSGDDGALTATITTNAETPAGTLAQVLRGLADSIENDPRRRSAT